MATLSMSQSQTHDQSLAATLMSTAQALAYRHCVALPQHAMLALQVRRGDACIEQLFLLNSHVLMAGW